MDRQYLLDQQLQLDGRIANVQKANKKEYAWSVQNFYGFASNSPQQIINSNVFGSSCINIIPEGQIMKKAPGAEAIGMFRDIDIFGGYKSMFCGRINVRRKGNYFFNMVQDSSNLQSDLYLLQDDVQGLNQINGIWQRIRPSSFTSFNTTATALQSNITLPTNAFQVTNVRINGNSLPVTNYSYTQNTNVVNLINPVLPNDTAEVIYQENQSAGYTFKGYKFDYVEYKGVLYICSGREDYLDRFGNRSGLLSLNLETLEWEAILTGKAAIIDMGKNGQQIINSTTLPPSYNGEDPTIFLHQLEDFNPSVIEEYQDRILISGATANPFQIKGSEHLNPKNFIDNVLGATALPATTDDLRKPFVLFANQEVLSLSTFGESVYIGTTDSFYKYDLKQIGNGLVDLVNEDKSTNSGPVSNKACKVFKGGQFYFGSNYQVVPELNLRTLETKFGISGNATVYASPPEKLTFFIDETLRRCDITNSCVGLYRDYVLWSVAFCPDKESLRDVNTNEIIKPIDNNLTILYSKLGDTPIYSILKEIRANWFSETGGRGLMYSSCDNGNCYLISEDFNYIDNHQTQQVDFNEPYIPEPTQFESIYQTGIVGYNPKQDSPYTKKRAKRFYFTGGFAGDSTITIEAIGIEGQCGENCCSQILFSKDITLKTDCDTEDCLCDLTPNLNFFKNTRTITRYFDIPIGENSAIYTSFFIRLRVLSSNFYINEIGGTYVVEDASMFDSSFAICDTDDNIGTLTVPDFFNSDGTPLIIESCVSCKM